MAKCTAEAFQLKLVSILEGANNLFGHLQWTTEAILYAHCQLSLSVACMGPHVESLGETAASTQCVPAFLAPSEGNFSSHSARL